MSGSRCIIDTNIFIDIFGGNKAFVKKLNNLVSVYIPVVVLGELYTGAYSSRERKIVLTQIEGILKKSRALFVDHSTSLIYGQIRADLKSRGKPMPENDIWIAALAKQHQLPIVTLDKHFNAVRGIKVRMW